MPVRTHDDDLWLHYRIIPIAGHAVWEGRWLCRNWRMERKLAYAITWQGALAIEFRFEYPSGGCTPWLMVDLALAEKERKLSMGEYLMIGMLPPLPAADHLLPVVECTEPLQPIGPFWGLRAWRVSYLGKLESFTRPVPWDGPVLVSDKAPQDWYCAIYGSAESARDARLEDGRLYLESRDPSTPGMVYHKYLDAHGIYAFKPTVPNWQRCVQDLHYRSGSAIAIGLVRLWGTLVECEHGYRASHAIMDTVAIYHPFTVNKDTTECLGVEIPEVSAMMWMQPREVVEKLTPMVERNYPGVTVTTQADVLRKLKTLIPGG